MSQFNRVSSFIVASQLDPNSNTDLQTAAEIVAVSTDGNTLIYSDSPQGQVGFVDITNPSAPVGLGVLDVNGEPTSVAVLDNFALVAVNTSPDFVNPSGQLRAIDIASQTIVRSLDIGGQPDSIAVSPDGDYAVIAIENERDEDLGDGGIPQQPAGFVVIVDTSSSNPANWTTTQVDLTGLSGVTVPEDPEPEFVDISSNNIAAVTLQENNAIVLIDLTTGNVINSFSAGTVSLANIDTVEDDIINQTSVLAGIPREPDGIAFIGTDYIATADEGDLDGGSRGFTIFDLNGNVVFTSGSEMDQIAARVGHYPEGRSENKGNEPENIEFASYDGTDYLFVNSERSSLVFVYNVDDPTNPVFQQVLPAGVGPEGGKAIPGRNLLVVASEEDSREDVIRSVINIYEFSDAPAAYPTLQSADGSNGLPIPWGAMSGLSAGPGDILYAVEDSFYKSNRFFTIDTSTTPATLTSATTIKDTNGVFAAVQPFGDFTADDLDALINDDNTVNIDPEGIAATDDGFLWIASEGAGTVGEASRPIESLNFLFKVNATDGAIAEVVTLPDELNNIQVRFGLEGVAYDNGLLVAVLQRAWGTDPNPRVLVYDTNTSEWVGDYFYPLDAVESQNGGWVGLSDIAPLGDGRFLVLERDNQGGPDAAVKRLYTIRLSPTLEDGDTLEKTFIRDLIPDFVAAGGLMPEKLEGLAVDENGVWVINDNDGVNDNSGETQLLNVGNLFEGQRLRGTNRQDRLIGGFGDDRLIGRGGNDRLLGRDGDDTLIGGRGRDRHRGGEGNDTFVFRRNDLRDRPDTIFDFEVGSDVINLRGVFRGSQFNSNDPFEDFVRIRGTRRRTNVQIDQNGNGEGEDFKNLVVLRGVDADTIDADSFLV
ncbi:MAG: esterase-like activity of phytase family protein [Leptolyngbyaceae bacterium]|nr:esterase-like activity of phytase family protein [Leptolyngbyaceae bacterium]